MKYVLKIFLSVFLLWLCAACSTKQSLDPALVPTAEYLEQNPLPTPEFIYKAATQSENRESFEFEIDGSALWEPGDGFPDQSNDYLQKFMSRLQVFVDEKSVPQEKFDIFMYNSLDPVFDKKAGKVIGIAAFWNVKVLTDYLAHGIHLVSVSVTSTAGVVRSYSWAFRL